MFKLHQLHKTYDQVTVVEDVNLTIPHGKITAFIGPNGAGKSTVLGMMSRLIPIDQGDVTFGEQSIRHWDSRALSRQVAILTQTNNVDMKLTVRELVGFGRFPHSGTHLTHDDWVKVDEAIQYMALSEYQDRFIDELSGGQRQRAFIAMVLAQDTDYILLDEPTNNLDIFHSRAMMKLLRRLSDELGKTIVVVLHEINLAAFYCDYICAFVQGRVRHFGTVNDIMKSDTLEDIYGVPFTIYQVDNKPLAIYH